MVRVLPQNNYLYLLIGAKTISSKKLLFWRENAMTFIFLPYLLIKASYNRLYEILPLSALATAPSNHPLSSSLLLVTCL